MSTDIEQAAHAEAHRRYQGDTDVQTGDPVDDWGYSEEQRRAFVAGAVWAVQHLIEQGLLAPAPFIEETDTERVETFGGDLVSEIVQRRWVTEWTLDGTRHD